MKTNLDSVFKVNSTLEKDGVWFLVNEETGFLVRRFSPMNPQYRSAITTLLKPFARQIQLGQMDPKKELEIGVKVFVRICMVDWKGIVIDGENVPYSEETAIKFFLALPELFKRIEEYASDFSSYREDLGNS